MNLWVTIVRLLREGYRVEFAPIVPLHPRPFCVHIVDGDNQHVGQGLTLDEALMEAVRKVGDVEGEKAA